MVSNRLYLNRGDFAFDDVTEKADVAGEGKWCSGVALVDINNDGLLDAFVCHDVAPNVYYINNGDGTFCDATKQGGEVLSELRVSRGAAFGDLDNDGDPDLVVLGRSEPNRLFENLGGGRFREASHERGLGDPARAYGFGCRRPVQVAVLGEP